MFICLCLGVSEKRLREVIAQGGKTLEELQSRCGAGSSCGGCLEDIHRALSQTEASSDRSLSSQERESSSSTSVT